MVRSLDDSKRNKAKVSQKCGAFTVGRKSCNFML